jgi:hypothetical protein
MGDTVAAVDRYADIPAPVRAALKRRMAARQYDEVAAIRRDSIEGRYSYGDLRDMHIGQGQVCRAVTREKWAPGAVERGLVYCESGHCLIVPTVCRNVSRVTRAPQPPAAAAGTGAGAASGSGYATTAPPSAGGSAESSDSSESSESSESSYAHSGAGSAPIHGHAGPGIGGLALRQGAGAESASFTDLSRADSTASFAPLARVASVPLASPGFNGSRFGLSRSAEAGGAIPPTQAFPEPPLVPAPPLPAPLAPVPEPTTYALMALGVGLVALRVRRRQWVGASALR